MENIYLSKTDAELYIKITRIPKGKRNIGIIEMDGHLNLKKDLREKIEKAGGNFKTAPNFKKSKYGTTHGVGGTNYDSFARFDSPDDAINYLKQYFNILFVSIDWRVVSPWLTYNDATAK